MKSRATTKRTPRSRTGASPPDPRFPRHAVFSWLFGRRSRLEREDVRIWPAEDAKLAGIAREILDRRDTDRAIVVVAHFRSTLRTLDRTLAQREIPHQRPLGTLGVVDIRMNPKPPAKVFLVSSEGLSETARMTTDDGDGKGTVSILLAETYPVPSREEAVASFAEGLPFRTRLSPHASLDEPLFDRFGAEKIRTFVTMLGPEEGENLQHPAVGAAIRRAQKKVARHAVTDERVDSPTEWFQYNFR